MEELASRNAAGGGDVAGMIQVGSSREWLDANLFGEQSRIDNILRRGPRGLAELCEQVDQKAANLLNIHQANVGSHGPGPGMKKGTGTTCTSGSKPPAASSCSPQLQSPAAVPSCSPQLQSPAASSCRGGRNKARNKCTSGENAEPPVEEDDKAGVQVQVHNQKHSKNSDEHPKKC